MKNVSDAVLLEVAGIAATLLGFFVVGLFFFVQRGMFPQAAEQAQRYLHSAARSVVVLFGMTLLLALGLVVLTPAWVSLLYLGMSLVLLWSLAAMSVAVRRLHRILDVRVMPQIGTWLAAAAVIALPWALGGLSPERAHLTWSILLIAALAFTSSASLVLFALEISRLEASIVGSQGTEEMGERVATSPAPSSVGQPPVDHRRDESRSTGDKNERR